jgi:hypothetical protein
MRMVAMLLRASATAVTLALAACGDARAPTLSPQCLARIASASLASAPVYPIAANWAGPFGLVPSSDPNAPPWLTKQSGFVLPANTMHSLAFDSPGWTRAGLLRGTLSPAGDSTLRIYLIDRQVRLLRAGEVDHRRLTMLDIRDSTVRADYERELALWAARLAPSHCQPT